MRVLIANNMAPFVWGGAEELAATLRVELIRRGHEAEILRLPFRHDPPETIPAQILAASRLRVDNVDRLIALKFPAYHIPHDNKVVWLLHQLRQAYDLYDAGHSNILDDPLGHEVRDIVRAADNAALGGNTVFVNSSVTGDRLRRYNGVGSQVLLPPLNDGELFTDAPEGSYLFAGGRINGTKRQELLLTAFARSRTTARLLIAGPPDTVEDRERLTAQVERLGVGDRVTVDARFLDRREYVDYLRNSAVVAYLPFDEDSLGYVTMEAAQAGKPVITTTDSGGIRQLVEEGVTGWVSEPDADSLAHAIDAAFGDRERRRRLGAAMHDRWTALGVNWDTTVERLLS